jgi:hypothetical protein
MSYPNHSEFRSYCPRLKSWWANTRTSQFLIDAAEIDRVAPTELVYTTALVKDLDGLSFSALRT